MDNEQFIKTLQSMIIESIKPVKEDLMSLKAAQHELHQISTAIRDRQEKTDAQLESLTMNINKIHGNIR